MMTIEGLTKKQVAFCKIIWAFDDEERFQDWFLSLPFKDKQIVESLLELMKQEILEETIILYEEDAKTLLARF